MTANKEYSIPFASLENGIHLFRFQVSYSFFENMENETFAKCDIQIIVSLNKQEAMLQLDFSINGSINLPCDRCSEYFDLIISGSNHLIVKLGNDYAEENEDVIVFPKNEHNLDLTQYIYEFILLLIPMKVEHPLDAEGYNQCNEELIKLMENYRPKIKNKGEKEDIDPRWEQLKSLK